jgi:hypothetical protein
VVAALQWWDKSSIELAAVCLPCSVRLRRAHADRDEELVVFTGFLGRVQEIIVDFTGDIGGFDCFPVYEHIFRVDSANVHLAAVVLVWVIFCLPWRARSPGPTLDGICGKTGDA